MTDDEARAVVLDLLGEIAPEADLDTVDPSADLRTEVDLDSMDFLNLVEGLAQRTGVDIPEADYGRVRSLTGIVDYLLAHAAATGLGR